MVAEPVTALAVDAGLSSPDGRHPEWLDASVAPRDDFFKFSNGAWIKSHPIPPDRAFWGVDSLLEQDNETFIRDLVVALTKEPGLASASVQRKVADFYLSGMDEVQINAAGVAPLRPELERIANLKTGADLLQEIAHLQMIGVSAPWQIGQMQDFRESTRVIATVTQAGLGLPGRDYYLKEEHSYAVARSAYLLHVARIFVLLGEAPSTAQQAAKTILSFETRLARDSMSDVEQRDPQAIYHPMSSAEAQELTPHISWRNFFASTGHPEIRSFNMAMPEFFAAVDRQLSETSLDDWKLYLRFQLIDAYAAYLSAPFVDEDFRMTQVLSGAEQLEPRWQRVLQAEDEALGFAIGEMYVARRFSPEAKKAAMDLVLHIRDALRADLATLSWMTPATRSAAIRKLDLMELRVGYPDKWRDYAALTIDRGPYVMNALRAKQFDMTRELSKVGKAVDRSEWYMTPQTDNAYYDRSMNSLNVPAGILTPPYFDVHWSAAVNYGATGASTIGHEMTHGFDDQGAKFDGHGNLQDWWAPQDLAKFRKATRCLANQFSEYKVAGGLHIQGELVTGEAAADLGGLVLAWRAFHDETGRSAAVATDSVLSGGYTAEQEFFIAFAHSWAGAVRPEQAEELIATDPHPPAQYRTNGTLANSADFQRVFNISTPSPMVKAERCVIW